MTTWGYEGDIGPDNWGELDPAFRLAAEGRQQSPIDIDTASAERVDLPGLRFDYREEQAVFVNNVHTLVPAGGEGSSLEFQGRRYRLSQFHFHTPSEHTIDGEQMPLEVHLVHQGPGGETLVVGVFVEEGGDEAELVAELAKQPTDPTAQASVPYRVSPSRLLVPGSSFFTYPGSLTTPPCTEQVTWIVMRDRARAPSSALATLRRIMGNNSRPTQPLHGRRIRHHH